jgi:hypothetical protein
MTGKLTNRGLRITFEHVLKALAAGITQHEVLEDYPELEQENIQASTTLCCRTSWGRTGFFGPRRKLKLTNLELKFIVDVGVSNKVE